MPSGPVARGLETLCGGAPGRSKREWPGKGPKGTDKRDEEMEDAFVTTGAVPDRQGTGAICAASRSGCVGVCMLLCHPPGKSLQPRQYDLLKPRPYVQTARVLKHLLMTLNQQRRRHFQREHPLVWKVKMKVC